MDSLTPSELSPFFSPLSSLQVDPKVGQGIQETGIPCNSDETVRFLFSVWRGCATVLTPPLSPIHQILEIVRGIRMHFDKYVKGLVRPVPL